MAIGSLLQFSQLLITKWWRALFLLMLVLLQLAAIRGPEDSWARGLMLAHFGLFIMWQPFMQAERRLTPSQALAIVAIALCILYLLNGWLLALWVSVLAGIVGGKVFLFQARWLRRFYLVVLLYLISLLLLMIAGVLLLLSFAWNPRAGFAGLSMYFSRYLLSVGLPFERWLHFLAELSQLETKPERFLKEACVGLTRLPWVSGGFWHTADESGDFGKVSRNSVEFTNQEIHLRVFTRQALSPSLIWHFHLLGQLLGEYYIAKQREQKLQQQTYVQAVHETGARMTHDVKNLLQSLNVLCAAAERDTPPDATGLSSLMRRQLPAITQRLQQTLDKLQKPDTNNGRFVLAKVWWEGLQRSYADRGVEFALEALEETVMLPKELFDCAGDNLLQNALRKRKLDGSVTVRASFRCNAAIEFSVCDSGAPVAAEVLKGLLRGPVPSEAGFGVGLYQASRLAEISGFSLQLRENNPGRVCFSLRGEVRRGARED